MRLRFYFAMILVMLPLLAVQNPVFAAGTVGTGSASSCTESALNSKLSGGGTITFNCGAAPVTIAITTEKTISASTTINGSGLITLNAGYRTRLFYVNGGKTLTLQNLTITGGNGLGNAHGANRGGAIFNMGTLNTSHVTFTANTSIDGGGAIFNDWHATTNIDYTTFIGNSHTTRASQGGGAIFNSVGNMTVTNSSFINNTSLPGHSGAIYNDGPGTIVNSIFSGNVSHDNGAIFNDTATLTIAYSTFAGNKADASQGEGGAIENYGPLTIFGSTFVGNSSSLGGALTSVGAPGNVVAVTNSTFSGNYANNTGAIYNTSSTMIITNSTIANNSGQFVGALTSYSGAFSLQNTIVSNNYNNGAGNCTGSIINGGGNLQYPGTSCGSTIPSGADPQLKALANYGGPTQTRALKPGSPAIGTALCVATTDQRGVPRPQGGTCDIGAYELITVGNGPTDTIGMYHPATGTFNMRNTNTSGVPDLSIGFGASTDIPIAGDWNGDGIDTVGVYRPSTGQFLLTDFSTPGAPITYNFTLGSPGDLPMVGDWDGNGVDGVGVFRPTNGLIYLKNSLTTGYADFQMVLGSPGDLPIAGDWNGDGYDNPGVFRPSLGTFFLTNRACNCSVYADYQLVLGSNGDKPIAGDWDGSGASGVGVFHPSTGTIVLRNTLTTGAADITLKFGTSSDKPVAGHWAIGAALDKFTIGITPSQPLPPSVKLAPTFVP
ncbi:MAG: choice-of-anchor Q domain-containing protein [Chloroflexota bacterium]